MRSHNRWGATAAVLLTGALALSACAGDDDDSDEASGGGAALDVLIASSGDAETEAVTEAVNAWAEDNNAEATVTPAQDINQQLGQGFASGNPPDVFYVNSDTFATYAQNGALEPYAKDLENADDFYETLRNSFTYQDTFYCAPKDFSTLALVINNDAWTAAGLTDSDIPSTWDQLTTVAQRLTTASQVGLAMSPEYARVGAFMVAAGGGLTNADATEATADSPENVEALTYLQGLMTNGSLRYSTDLGTGWGGEAFGKGLAAMTVEGNWISGAMSNDYPTVNYRAVPMPEGPGGPGTLSFTNCWGIAAASDNKEAALSLVQQLTSTDQQMDFARAFGVMPSVESAADDFSTEFPNFTAFLDGADYAVGNINVPGVTDVVGDLNAQLETLATGDPQAIMSNVQTNLEAAIEAAQ